MKFICFYLRKWYFRHRYTGYLHTTEPDRWDVINGLVNCLVTPYIRHYLSKCWPWSMSPYGVTRAWVRFQFHTLRPQAHKAIVPIPGSHEDHLQYCIHRTDSRLAPSQWETSLQSNAVSHWLGASLESVLRQFSLTRKSSQRGIWYFGTPLTLTQTLCSDT